MSLSNCIFSTFLVAKQCRLYRISVNEGSGAYLKFRLKGRALIEGGTRGGGGGALN